MTVRVLLLSFLSAQEPEMLGTEVPACAGMTDRSQSAGLSKLLSGVTPLIRSYEFVILMRLTLVGVFALGGGAAGPVRRACPVGEGLLVD